MSDGENWKSRSSNKEFPMTDNLYECQRLIRQIHRDCTAITSQHEQAMADIKKLYHPIGSTPPSTPQVTPAPAAPAEKPWKFLNPDGSLSSELSQKATKDPALFRQILDEVQAAADEAKGQS